MTNKQEDENEKLQMVNPTQPTVLKLLYVIEPRRNNRTKRFAKINGFLKSSFRIIT